jgi:hypothetical protein
MGVCVALAAALTAASPEPQPATIARRMMQAMGGVDGWRKARFVRFDFLVRIEGQEMISRAHLWDRQTGRYRIEDRSANGQAGVVLFNLGNEQGAAYVEGKKLDGPAALAALRGARRTHAADIDWLALGWEWLDPGVRLKYGGQKTLEGKVFDVVEVTVPHSGLPQPNRYVAFVSAESHLLEHCAVLGSGDKGLWDWQYKTTGGIKLADNHSNASKRAAISLGDVRVLDRVEDAFFTDPAHQLRTLK